MEQLSEEDAARKMPDCDHGLVNEWMKCGLCQYTDGGNTLPVPWQEIRAYSNGKLTEWECSQIRIMSESYCGEKSQATADISRPAPYFDADMLEAQRKAVASKLKGAFRRKV